MKRSAFTLIELLIVVAIIAILAAIAVPNFLEAQARAKVSRTMNDMRSTGTGMIAYTVDTNQIPAYNYDGAAQDYWGARFLMIYQSQGPFAGRLITTPVAYITSIPIDIYNTALRKKYGNFIGGSGYAQVGKAWSWVYSGEKFGVTSKSWNDPQTGFIKVGLGIKASPKWIFESAGPDGTWWNTDLPMAGGPDRFWYDPTNGTNSQGQLVYSDVGFLSPRVIR